jgi:anti-sigma regulatory factor (Ser/Thr protein kinase)
MLGARDVPEFHHEAVFYGDREQYLAGTLPDIRQALAGDGGVLVAVAPDKRQLLEDALGGDAEDVQFVDMRQLGRNPACIIPAWREFLRDAGSGPVVGVGEPVWPGRSDAELIECSRHEALLNLAFDGGRPWRLLCPYDVTELAPDVLYEAYRNHPHVACDGASELSHEYAGSLAREDPLPTPTRRPTELPFGPHDLVPVRRFVAAQARAAGFAGEQLEDIVLAVNELVANSIRHGGGEGVVRAWHDAGTFFCEVRDGGVIEDPLVGRERPAGLHDGGRGLWIVNHLCDLVQMRSSPTGTVVRLRLDLA